MTDSSGAVVGPSNGEYITDENGRIVIDDLEPGTTITAREVKTLEGYVLDTAPKSIEIKSGEVQTLRVLQQQAGHACHPQTGFCDEGTAGWGGV